MTRDALAVSPGTGTRQRMTLMGRRKIRHLRVLEGDTVLGMISIHDSMDDRVADHEATIAQPEPCFQS
jgi:signal-transduction protein with cAMP-binding, CBS, and nucleotidyltransferase domain